MDFKKQPKPQQQQQSTNEDDQYIQEIKRRLLIKKQKGPIADDSLQQYYTEDQQDIDQIGQFRLEQSIHFWSMVTIAAITSRFLYPPSVRFVKKYIKLDGYLNVHMGIVPFIFISNGIVLGVHEAFWNIYWFNKQVKQVRK